MKRISLLSLSFALMAALPALAQKPVPGKPQTKSILLMNGVAHIGNGTVIENSVIGFRNGKIELVGDARTVRIDRSAWDTVADCSGKHLYPGLIAPNSTLGLTEVEAVRASNDQYEVGGYNPHVRSLIAWNTDSKIIPTVRTNGVLMAQVTPRGGRISGTSSVMHLDGWNWEDAVHKADDGIHINWPSYISYNWTEQGPGGYERSKRYLDQRHELEQFFTEAKVYCSVPAQPEKNLRYEAMRGVFNGSKAIYIHADYVKEITEAVAFAQKFGLKRMVIVGGADSWMCTAELKAASIPVMLGRVHSLPQTDGDDVNQSYKTPSQLMKAGVLFCLQNAGDQEAHGTRNLPFLAGTAAAWGLSKEEALMSVTLSSAKILGVDAQCGSLEPGKDATLFVSDGDALDMRGNHVRAAWIQGRRLDLRNEQTEMAEKYQDKYGLKKKQ
ncbi:MAG: amidohydrolase family protein [Bacteroidetes bacterium]|nr:amidohydrolase family protein [Bacteroidota bacterium]